MKNIIVLVISCFFFGVQPLKAQEPKVEGVDIYYTYYKVLNEDSITYYIDSVIDSRILFNINGLENVSKVYLNVDSEVGGNSTLSKSYNVVNRQGVFYLENNGQLYAIDNNFVELKFDILPSQILKYRYLDIFLENKLGEIGDTTQTQF